MIKRDLRSYSFKPEELLEIARFFRKMDTVPEVLTEFQLFLQNYIYDSMTIIEAEHFFNEE